MSKDYLQKYQSGEKRNWNELSFLSSSSNRLISECRSLATARGAKRSDFCLCEGLRFCETMLESSLEVKAVLLADTPEAEAYYEILAERFPSAPYYRYDRSLEKSVSAADTPSPITAIARFREIKGAPDLRKYFQDAGDRPAGPGAFILLDNLRDPGNLGTIIRTADCNGFQKIILAGNCVSPKNAKAVRASAGSVFAADYYALSLAEFLNLKEEMLAGDFSPPLITADLAGYNLADFAGESENEPGLKAALERGFILAVGNEAEGIAPELAAASDIKLTIEQRGLAESFNVAAAFAIISWEMAKIYFK